MRTSRSPIPDAPSSGRTSPTSDAQDVAEQASFDDLLRRVARISEPSHPPPSLGLFVGTTLAAGRLSIVRRIGEGGMGVVYEAYDAERRARVALKTLTRLEAAGIYRLKSEFRALSHVRHPNLVQLHELFFDAGHWFFTMDLLEGEPFDRWVRPAGLDETRLRGALSQLASAIDAIHGDGKLHRDLKPSNVLVTREGRLVVLDFGLVMAPQLGGVGQTVAGEKVIGTPAYMPPEQAMGMVATAASDFYAVGVMLFEALTGQLPFEGNAQEVLSSKQCRDAPRVCSLAPLAPADLAELCDRLLERPPAARPNAAELRHVLGVEPAQAESSTRASLAPDSTPVFFGRGAELASVREAYRETLRGRATVLLVSGESGMGKSTLVEAFVHELRAQNEAVVLSGRCNERENVPYKALDALVDQLSHYLRKIPAQEAAELMPREAFTLARLFPVLSRVPVIANGPQKTLSPQHLQTRAFAAFAELMARMCDRRPLVLFVDDLQWTDEDSAHFIAHVLLHVEPAPALLVFAYRSEHAEQNPLLQSVIAAARGNCAMNVRELAVGALDDAALAELVRLRLADSSRSDSQVRSIAREAGGSPFLAGELARAAAFRAPSARLPTLTEALSQHVGQLPAAARRLLHVMALAGQPLAPALALEAAGLSAGHEELDALRGERLLRVSMASGNARAVECYHDCVREFVAGSVAATLARELFAGLARALSSSPSPEPELLTRCLEGAGLPLEASRTAHQAAERAMQALAYERAARLYEKALTLGSFDAESARALQVARGTALARAGHGVLAGDLYLAARAGAAPERAAMLTREAGVLLLMLGRNVRGRELLAEGLRPLGIKIPKTSLRAFVALLWARLSLWLHGLRFSSRARHDPLTLARLEGMRAAASSFAPSDSLRFALFSAHYLRMALRAGHTVEAARAVGGELVLASYMPNKRRRIPRLRRLADTLVDGTTDADARFSMRWGSAWSCLTDVPWCGDWTASLEHTDACLDLAREHPVAIGAYVEPWCQYMRGTILLALGQLAEVSDIVRTQFERELVTRNLSVLPPLSSLAALVLPALGQLAEADRVVRESRALWRSDEVTVQDLNVLMAVSFLARHRAEALSGWSEFRAFWRRIDGSFMPRIIMGPMLYGMGGTLAAAAARETSQVSEQRALRREARRLLRRAAAFGSRAARLTARAQLACLSGEQGKAIGHLRDLLGLSRLSPLVAQSATRQLGVLLGGAEGRAQTARADQWLCERGVVEPARLAALIVPSAELLRDSDIAPK